MPLITETYYLSLTQDNRGILRLRCSQDDTLRTVNLKLYNNGSVFVIPSGISASVSGVKQNGAVFSKSCTISQDRQSVVLQLSSDITSVDGIIVAEIVLSDGEGGRLGASNFIIQVEKNPIRAGVVQDTETPIEYINDFIEKIQTLTARLNNLITPSGDASLAEVIDARISSLDSNTYQNLKARIDADIATLNTNKANASNVYTKQQVDNLLENVEIDVDSELSDESENPVQNKVVAGAISEVKADLDVLSSQIGAFTWVTGQYIPTNIDPVDVSNIQANATWKYILVEATPGEQYTLANVSSGNAARAWCITDASGNVLDVADSMTDYAEQVITIPELGAYLIVHAYASTENADVTGVAIKTRVNELEAELNSAKDSLEAEIEETKGLIGDFTPTITISYDFYDAILALLENAYYRTGASAEALDKLRAASSLYVYDGGVYLSKYYTGIEPIQSCRTLIG